MIDLKSIIENFIEKEDKNLVDIILEIVTKIKNLPNNTKTTISKLIDFKPEKTVINPLKQGKIFRYVRLVCKEININLEQLNKNYGGLAYNFEFKILLN